MLDKCCFDVTLLRTRAHRHSIGDTFCGVGAKLTNGHECSEYRHMGDHFGPALPVPRQCQQRNRQLVHFSLGHTSAWFV